MWSWIWRLVQDDASASLSTKGTGHGALGTGLGAQGSGVSNEERETRNKKRETIYNGIIWLMLADF